MTCERCGKNFNCLSTSTHKACWCLQLPTVANLPVQYKKCLCPGCLNDFISPKKDQGLKGIEGLEEGIDFYFANSYIVFTEKYHLDRGSCCGSGCRNCPYR